MKRRKIITGTRKVLENCILKTISTICLDDDEKAKFIINKNYIF